MAFCADPLKRGCMAATMLDGVPCGRCRNDLDAAEAARREAVEALPEKQRRAYDVLEARGDWMPGTDLARAIESPRGGFGNVINKLLLEKKLITLRSPEGVNFPSTEGYEYKVKPL